MVCVIFFSQSGHEPSTQPASNETVATPKEKQKWTTESVRPASASAPPSWRSEWLPASLPPHRIRIRASRRVRLAAAGEAGPLVPLGAGPSDQGELWGPWAFLDPATP